MDSSWEGRPQGRRPIRGQHADVSVGKAVERGLYLRHGYAAPDTAPVTLEMAREVRPLHLLEPSSMLENQARSAPQLRSSRIRGTDHVRP